MLAAVRPGSWNLVLYVHVIGAVLLVATLIVDGYALLNARRRGDDAGARFAFRSLWMTALPALIVMRVGAQLIVSKEHLENSDASWIGIGFGTADGSALLLLVAILLAGLAVRRRGAARGLRRAAAGLVGIILIADVLAIYAMTAKPA